MKSISRALPLVLLLGACEAPQTTASQPSPPTLQSTATSLLVLEADRSAFTDQVLAAVRRRVEAGGFATTKIKARDNRLRIETTASGENLDRLVSLLTRPGMLSFNAVDMDAGSGDGRKTLPDDSQGGKPVTVFTDPIIAGADFADARPILDTYSKSAVAIDLSPDAAKRFSAATRNMVGKAFAIIVDDRILSAPTLMGPITGGTGQITGNMTTAEAEQLATIIRAGPLPRLTLVERTAART